MSFKTTLKAAIIASEAINVGVGLGVHQMESLYGVSDNGEEVLIMELDAGRVLARNQEIEVDDNGCAIFEATDGTKHAIQMSVMRALTEADLPSPEFSLDETVIPDGATIH